MLMPMLWTDDFDDMMNDFFYGPFYDDVVSLIPTKDEVETEKSIDRHDRKEARKYYEGLRRGFNKMNNELNQLMKTDVVEKDGNFEIKADLPGFDKKDINIGLKNGILNVSATHSTNNDEKDEKTGKYLRRERTASSYQRAFNVGKEVKPEEINAKYDDGVLTPESNVEL